MDARTRDRLPLLPVLVRAAAEWRSEAEALLATARETEPGQQFSAAGQTLVRSVRRLRARGVRPRPGQPQRRRIEEAQRGDSIDSA